MLKDGTSEVWPEYLERIFIQGLHAYWQSPWATYTKGRSRWRNQFLVDFLHNAGIERSKKQVASHIQVLRNMWKGQKEYDLVASADELPSAIPGRAASGSHRAPRDRTRKSSSSSRARSLSSEEPSSPINVKEEPPEDGSEPGLLAVPEDHEFPAGLRLLRDDPEDEAMKLKLISSPALSNSISPGPLSPFTAFSPIPESDASSPPGSVFAGSDGHFSPPHHHAVRGRSSSAAPIPIPAPAPAAPACQLSTITLWAEGMQPVSFDVGAILAGAQPGARAVLRVQLSASLLSDVTSPPTMHGFQGTATFSGRWLHSATCVTRVIVNGVCDSQEAGAFDAVPSPASVSAVPVQSGPGLTALLPDSWLSRCRWRNSAVPTRLTQQIIVDGTEVATILYDLQRPQTGCAAAALVGCTIEPPRARAVSSERAPPTYTWEPRARPVVQPRSQTLSFPPYGGSGGGGYALSPALLTSSLFS